VNTASVAKRRAKYLRKPNLENKLRSSHVRYLQSIFLAGAAVAIVFFAFVAWVGEKSGATMLPEEMGLVQSRNAELVVEPFDLHYWAAMKIQRIAHDQPEVVSIGSSRGHEMRSEMFRPYRFYNASLTAWTLKQEIEMVDRITSVSKPRVIIIGLDYSMLIDQLAAVYNAERTMQFENGFRYRYRSSLAALKTIVSQPVLLSALWNKKGDAIPDFIGLHALQTATGFRFDGSRMMSRAVYQAAPNYLARNIGLLDAVPGAPHVDPGQLSELERLAKLAKDRDVLLVAIQYPIYKASVDYLDKEPSYQFYSGVWRDFQSDEMLNRLRNLGITFFDLSRTEMTADGRYFTDAAHPTEVGISVALSDLLRDERFRKIFPAIDPERLRADREKAAARGDAFEIYDNDQD
jgi:hypothetical protein